MGLLGDQCNTASELLLTSTVALGFLYVSSCKLSSTFLNVLKNTSLLLSHINNILFGY